MQAFATSLPAGTAGGCRLPVDVHCGGIAAAVGGRGITAPSRCTTTFFEPYAILPFYASIQRTAGNYHFCLFYHLPRDRMPLPQRANTVILTTIVYLTGYAAVHGIHLCT